MASSATGTALGHIQQLYSTGSVAGLSDDQLVKRFAAQRDEAAFEALVARHGPLVLSVCRAILKDEHAAEDAFQATFLTLARKAGSLWSHETLGGWLYRVAYRNAVRAGASAERRHGRERAAIALEAARTRGGTNPWRDDWLPVLHEEIDRLPERERAPIVLCYLQELTYEQAAQELRWTAQELRWTAPALRCRLAKVRERLRGRLSRRGMGTTGAGAALATWLDARPASAGSVPPAWAHAAVRTAMGGAAGAIQATALMARILAALSWTRLREAVTIALTLGAVMAIGVFAMNQGRPYPDRPPGNSQADPPRSATAPAPAVVRGTAEVRGQVVDPAGKPVTGATVQMDSGQSAVSGSDGRYTLVAPRDVLESFARGETEEPLCLVATAPGYGPGWAEAADRSGALKDVTVRLAADDLPIEGRILDLEGRPVAGAEVATSAFYDRPGGNLTPWIESMKANPTGPNQSSLKCVSFAISQTTGPDGRFRLDGLGRERVVMFTISGPTIALTRTFAMTKDVPPIHSSNTHIIGPRTMVFHGARFDFAVAPCKPVLGTVRDHDTGAPLAGVRVNGMVSEKRNLAYYNEIESTTDDQGRYHLTGMAKGEKYRLFLFPSEGQPYCNASFVKPAATGGFEPATIDLRLKRGLLVRGRVTDKVTGLPVKEASVESYAMRDNPHVNDYPGFREGYATTVGSDEDGRFAIAVLPGRGILAVRAGSEYLTGVGAEATREKGSMTSLPVYPAFMSAGNHNLIASFNAAVGAEPIPLNLQLDPGRSLSVTVVAPDGKPVPGCMVSGTRPMTSWESRPLDSATFAVTALDPREPRHVMVFHNGRKLGGSTLIDENDQGSLTIRLQPCGVVTGRLIDEEGLPRKNLDLINLRGDDEERGVFHRRCPVDPDGRFRIEVIPDLAYSAHIIRPEQDIQAIKVLEKVRAGTGEVKDLGDLLVK